MQGTLISNFFIFTILILKVWFIVMSHEEPARQLYSLPRSWWTGLKLSTDNCSCSFHRYERCCPCCGAHGNIRGGQSVLYIWGQCLLPIFAFSDSGIRTAHWLIALTLTGLSLSLLLPALTECQRCWEKWDKTAQKSCWYRLPGLDCWVNGPECVNCEPMSKNSLRDGKTAALSSPTLMWSWHHSLASAHVLASQWRIYFISAQIKMMSWVCLEMEIMLNKTN